MKNSPKITVLGGGSWGSALACQVARAVGTASLYVRNQEVFNELCKFRMNSLYLKDLKLPDSIEFYNDFDKSICQQDVIIIAIPSSSFEGIINKLKDSNLHDDTIILVATKGLVDGPVELMSERIGKILPNEFAFLSGPNFAYEVALGLPSSTTIAAEDIKLAERLASMIQTENFQVSITNDIITIQVAALLKNIIAIQIGIEQAKGYGENARAATLCQGLKEIKLLSEALGGKFKDVFLPGVIGDLALTCYSKTSRNMRFGFELAKSEDPAEFIKQFNYLAEGREAALLMSTLLKNIEIDLSIVRSVINAITS